jgi:hypothetical protein
VSIHRAHLEPIRDVTTFMEGIVTVCNQNIVKFWARPTNNRSEEDEVEDIKVVDNIDLNDEKKIEDDTINLAHIDMDMVVDESGEKGPKNTTQEDRE